MGIVLKKNRHIWARARVILLAALLITITACNANGNPTTAQRTVSVTRGTLVVSVNATGNILAEGEIMLSFQQPGVVQQVNVKVDDTVKEGQMLASLDTQDLELALAQARTALITANAGYSRTVEGASQADIDAAQAALNAAYSNYDKVKAGPDPADYASAQATYLNAQAALKQAQDAYDRAYASDPANINGSPEALQLEQATNNYNSAKAAFQRASEGADNAQLSAALQQIESAKATLDKLKQPVKPYDVEQAQTQQKQAQLQVSQAERRLAQAQLIAPKDGVISVLGVNAGETVAAQPAMTLVDTSKLHIDITVDEVDVAKIKPGQEVIITLDALPGVELKGVVDRVAPTATTISGVVSYLVRVVLDKTDAPLKVGMTANTSIVLDQHTDILMVPNWAVRRDRQTGKAYLTLQVDEKTSKEVEVQTGLRNDANTEILSGVNEGQVIMAPQTSLFSQ
jgi:HlyD family secretion protein